MSLQGIKRNEVYRPQDDYDRFPTDSTVNESSGNFGIGDEGSKHELGYLQSKGSTKTSDTFFSIEDDVMDGGSLESEGDDGIAQQVETLKAQIEKNPNLDDKTKKMLLDKLSDVKTIESINVEQAEEKLDGINEEIQNYTLYSPAAMRLSKELGVDDPAAVQEMLDRHGIDGKSPTLDPAKLEALLTDPMIAEAVSAEQEAHNTAHKTLTDMAPKKASEAHAVNAATDLKDSSTVVDTDTSSFQWLYETAQGTSQEAKEVLKTGTALAEKKAKILSALTNTKIEANPNQPGMINLPNGEDFNAVANKSGGPAIEWPKIEIVPFHGDWEGDGQTAVPDWMKQANYPYHSIDDGGWNPMGLVLAGAASVVASPFVGASAVVTGTAGGVAGDLMAYEPENPY